MPDPTIISVSASSRAAFELAARFAPRSSPILVVGPTGTGKEVIASAIHRLSGRSGRFVELNCGALPRELIESALFGHRKGAFSGAFADVPGLIEAANHGTLFLDELAGMPVESQVKLLKVLEEGWVARVGDTLPRPVDVRFVGAVQAANRGSIDRRQIRSDLLHRLSGVVIDLAPLSERPEDVMALARHFAAQHDQVLDLSCDRALLHHAWPGNVRELRHTIERAAVLSSNGHLHAVDIVRAIDLGLRDDHLPLVHRSDLDFERVIEALVEGEWHADQTARILRVGRTTLFRRLKGMGFTIRTARAYHESRYGNGTSGTLSPTAAPADSLSRCHV